MQFKFFGIICLLTVIHSTRCLHCYSCRSAPDNYCGKTFHESIIPVRNCSEPGYLCTKIAATIDNSDAIERSCLPSDFCSKLPSSYKRQSCDTCDEDFCNSSSNITPSLAVLIINILVLTKARLY